MLQSVTQNYGMLHSSHRAKKREERRKKGRKAQAKLSFSLDEEEEEDLLPLPKRIRADKDKKNVKDPSVDTSFLPDRERDAEELRLRDQLKDEWQQQQEQLKREEMEVTYSFWDGTGHRHSVKCRKGDSIADFLERCRQQLHQLRHLRADNLLYVKEDLIIPHHYTFYDLIVSKARGKSGPLFHFDVHDDVRLLNDSSVEKDESHAGKVVERGWYNRHKHIFPANRWEVYDPDKDNGAYRYADRAAP